ncbi:MULTISPECIES: hypothetical protein [unclassified Bradyrhizobium]|uniref:hypothetical protein n=1 Tax=unclassified Bradyrhizobium TaxID=2631580 RepID=UPI001161088F|nr:MULTISPECIES: hypothetical protein [unclassified Bradyrhizobium]
MVPSVIELAFAAKLDALDELIPPGSGSDQQWRGTQAVRASSVKNADLPERRAEVGSIRYSILQASLVLGRAFLRFGILLSSDS